MADKRLAGTGFRNADWKQMFRLSPAAVACTDKFEGTYTCDHALGTERSLDGLVIGLLRYGNDLAYNSASRDQWSSFRAFCEALVVLRERVYLSASHCGGLDSDAERMQIAEEELRWPQSCSSRDVSPWILPVRVRTRDDVEALMLLNLVT